MEIQEVIVKSTPPAVLTAWSMWGFSLNEWAAIAGITYSVLMIVFLLKDRFDKWKKEKDASSK